MIREAQPRKWPVFRSHNEVRCFNCGAQLNPNRTGNPSEYPEGRWFGICAEGCGMGTFYDLADETGS